MLFEFVAESSQQHVAAPALPVVAALGLDRGRQGMFSKDFVPDLDETHALALEPA